MLTDGLIGTFAAAHEPSLRQNRCFLYHVIGNGDGHWDVPVGGMGALTDALAARRARRGRRDPLRRRGDRRSTPTARSAGTAARPPPGTCSPPSPPPVLARLLGEPDPEPPAEGAQLKLNMLLSRLPRLRDAAVDPREAFAGTFHVNESATQLQAAYEQADARRDPARCRRARSTATRSRTRRSSDPSCARRARRR